MRCCTCHACTSPPTLALTSSSVTDVILHYPHGLTSPDTYSSACRAPAGVIFSGVAAACRAIAASADRYARVPTAAAAAAASASIWMTRVRRATCCPQRAGPPHSRVSGLRRPRPASRLRLPGPMHSHSMHVLHDLHVLYGKSKIVPTLQAQEWHLRHAAACSRLRRARAPAPTILPVVAYLDLGTCLVAQDRICRRQRRVSDGPTAHRSRAERSSAISSNRVSSSTHTIYVGAPCQLSRRRALLWHGGSREHALTTVLHPKTLSWAGRRRLLG